MRLTMALLLPWLLFFTIRRPIAGGVCLLLQLTVVGWLPAAFWASHALGQYKTARKLAALEKRLQAPPPADEAAATTQPDATGPAELELGLGEAQNAAAESTEQTPAADPARPAGG